MIRFQVAEEVQWMVQWMVQWKVRRFNPAIYTIAAFGGVGTVRRSEPHGFVRISD